MHCNPLQGHRVLKSGRPGRQQCSWQEAVENPVYALAHGDAFFSRCRPGGPHLVVIIPSRANSGGYVPGPGTQLLLPYLPERAGLDPGEQHPASGQAPSRPNGSMATAGPAESSADSQVLLSVSQGYSGDQCLGLCAGIPLARMNRCF